MKTLVVVLIAALGIFFWGMSVPGYLPYIVFSQDAPIRIDSPESAQVYYAELAGVPQTFLIVSPEPFDMHIELLVPALASGEADYSLDIQAISGGENVPFASLAATSSSWGLWSDPFAKDDYLAGPLYEGNAPAREYLVTVTSPDNQGKFVLWVGVTGQMTLGGLLHTAETLPIMKAYLGISPVHAYTNPIGAIALGAVLSGVTFLLIVWRLTFTLVRRKKVVKLPRIQV